MRLLQKIAFDLHLDEEYLAKLVDKADNCYKNYKIKKATKGYREISQASPELKTLQYWVKKKILSKLPVAKSAFAYQKGASIKKHAEYHLGAKHMFHTDIHDFFLSITSAHLVPILIERKDVFESLDLDVYEAAVVIARICFRSDFLCMGTVSSPIISNIIMFGFDNKMEEFCKLNHLKYSRYSDDIYISSKNYIKASVFSKVKEELNKMGFELNPNKTRFVSSKNKMMVTGLTIQKNEVSIGSIKKQNIKRMIYKKLVHSEGNSSRIMGYLSFLKDIEPQTYNRYIIKYTPYSHLDVIDGIKTNKETE